MEFPSAKWLRSLQFVSRASTGCECCISLSLFQFSPISHLFSLFPTVCVSEQILHVFLSSLSKPYIYFPSVHYLLFYVQASIELSAGKSGRCSVARSSSLSSLVSYSYSLSLSSAWSAKREKKVGQPFFSLIISTDWANNKCSTLLFLLCLNRTSCWRPIRKWAPKNGYCSSFLTVGNEGGQTGGWMDKP